MASVIRQNNLFAGEDFTKVYKSFQSIDFTVYDYDGIKNALIEYIRTHYPEDFNDYTESSEFVAIVELLAYLGTSLAFRSDLNARENILDTAERRESIIRLAKMINYHPKRNIAATGLFKIRSVVTDQPIKDSNNNNLSGAQITWNDPNNPNWFDQFIHVMNAVFNPTNSFGRPSKSGDVGGIKTDLYQLNNVLGTNVAYRTSTYVNNEQVSFDLVNPDIDTILVERNPDPNEAFNFVYRNDKLGFGSSNTGFFIMFKQGRMDKKDYFYEFAEPNRIEALDINDINNDDVYVQEIDIDGNVIRHWEKVPALYGNNIVYNNLNFDNRHIFEVNSGYNDTVSIKYPDGNFGEVPTGIMRVWYRTSSSDPIKMNPEEVSPISTSFSYIGKNGQTYRVTVTLGLESSVTNSAPSETNEQIKLRAPQVYYSQDRMINNQDYNVFPLSYGNEIFKIKSVNRTYAGHSRYTGLSDPTGFHKDLTIIDDDGYIYNDETDILRYIDSELNASGSLTSISKSIIEEALSSPQSKNFFYLRYLPDVKSNNPGIFDFNNIYWKTMPDSISDDTGFFINDIDASSPNWPYDAVVDTTISPMSFIKAGAILTTSYTNSISCSVTSVSNSGIPSIVETNGPVRLGSEINDISTIDTVIPPYRTTFTDDEVDELSSLVINNNSFSIRYDAINDEWVFGNFSNTSVYDYNDPTNNWFVNVRYVPANITETAKFEVVVRGIKTVFGSFESVKFFWDKDNSRKSDQVTIMSGVNTGSDGNPLEDNLVWDIVDRYYLTDGTMDDTKVVVLPSDVNDDGILDNPYIFSDLVAPKDEVLLKLHYDQYGYSSVQPWVSKWADVTIATVGQLAPIRQYPAVFLDLDRDAIVYGGYDNNTTSTIPDKIFPLTEYGLYMFGSYSIIDELKRQLDVLYSDLTKREEVDRIIDLFNKKNALTVGIPGDRLSGNKTMYKFSKRGNRIILVEHDNFWSRNGKSFTLDSGKESKSFIYKWNHYVQKSKVVDPSPTNIIDIIMITHDYYDSIVKWKKERGSRSDLPLPPSTTELRDRFYGLEQYKSISDHLSYNSGKFKVLFGDQAPIELQAKFKAIKVPGSNISDNELKSKIVESIDEFFNIDNWDFGESFYFTELASFIHSKLMKHLSSIVIVPKFQESEFGDLFEIKCSPDEVFISTASVMDIDVINNYTNTNLRM